MIKDFAFGGKEILEPLVQVIFVRKGLVSPGIAQGQEQMISGERKICAIRLVNKHFSAQLKQILANDFFDVGSGVGGEEVDGPVAQAIALGLPAAQEIP